MWDTITSPERLADWWLPFDADITVDLRVGGRWSLPEPTPANRSRWYARSCVSTRHWSSSTLIRLPDRRCVGNSKLPEHYSSKWGQIRRAHTHRRTQGNRDTKPILSD
ncbi:MAG: SRPBCC domain-containing protein [Ilumatobacteraceae bacterium]